MAKFPVETLKGKDVPTNENYLLKWGGEENFDIGCGPSKIDGFKGVDIREFPSIDIVHDLNVIPWPIDNSSANLVIASHVVEHVDSVISFMSELHRILKDDGKLVIRYPHYSQRHTFRDPTHKRFMTLESLDYFIFESELFGEYSNFGFRLIRKIMNTDNDIAWILSKLSFESYEKYWCKLFPAWQVILEIEK